jgi:hypothetical protein
LEVKVVSVRARRNLEVVSHGARLNVAAALHTNDANAAHLVVHGVLARAMDDEAAPISHAVLDDALSRALAAGAVAHPIMPLALT